MPTLWPGSEVCECPVCHRFFSTTSNFDRHREGDHGEGNRRCLSPDEMIAKGMFERNEVWKQLPAESRVYGGTALSGATIEDE